MRLLLTQFSSCVNPLFFVIQIPSLLFILTGYILSTSLYCCSINCLTVHVQLGQVLWCAVLGVLQISTVLMPHYLWYFWDGNKVEFDMAPQVLKILYRQAIIWVSSWQKTSVSR